MTDQRMEKLAAQWAQMRLNASGSTNVVKMTPTDWKTRAAKPTLDDDMNCVLMLVGQQRERYNEEKAKKINEKPVGWQGRCRFFEQIKIPVELFVDRNIFT